MIKIRLHGSSAEVKKATEELKNSFEVLAVSGEYKDRNSELVRVYVDAEVKGEGT